MGLGVQLWLGTGGVHTGDGARRLYRRHPGQGRRLCRQHLRVSDRLYDRHRPRPARRLCAAGRELARLEDDGRDAGLWPPGNAALPCACAFFPAGDQHLDAADPPAGRASLVRRAEHLLPVDPAGLECAGRLRDLARARGREALPFLLSVALFLLALLGLGISLWPYAVPYSLTLWQAASSASTLGFLGVGTIVIIPIILAYLGYVHWVFRGKTAAGTGYGH